MGDFASSRHFYRSCDARLTQCSAQSWMFACNYSLSIIVNNLEANALDGEEGKTPTSDYLQANQRVQPRSECEMQFETLIQRLKVRN
jgi:hypothetical protein